jgi:prepilin-type N-terminal cleavage/methylation domain-containing protein
MRKNDGFTLLEIAVVLIIIGLVASFFIPIAVSSLQGQRRVTTSKLLDVAEQALVAYVIINRRLPCPADGSLPSTDTNAGLERGSGGTCTNNQLNGVFPWRTVGISEPEATDAWNGRFMYRVDANLTKTNALDMNLCDPAAPPGNTATGGVCAACTAATLSMCTPPSAFLSGKGLDIQNAAGVSIASGSTAAAYVLITHGENGAKAFNASGTVQPGNGTAGPNELINRSDQALVAAYVDDVFNGSDTNHFDDIVRRQTIIVLATKAGLGPRSH